MQEAASYRTPTLASSDIASIRQGVEDYGDCQFDLTQLWSACTCKNNNKNVFSETAHVLTTLIWD
jgi:hypothetical protein